MRKILLLLPVVGLSVLTGCNAPIPLAIGEASGIYATRPDKLPEADTASQMPPHETWCYSTLGEVAECFTQPQDTIPGRLVNVDPASRYPMTVKAYRERVTQSQLEQAPKLSMQPVAMPDLSSPSVQSSTMTPIPLIKQQKPAPAPKAADHKAKKSKQKSKKHTTKPVHKKTVKKPIQPCPCPAKQEPLNGIEP